ncbi:Flp family type IVb pilin [Paraburkholderia phosphatilytica]|uniref:Flp family type IVb pilin n=1 Tax=Paraburkholderia phosphatilytica TaxID=2282883 RepID=UPI001F0C8D0E|nr:Flp family type IVb pilin [Paraburkholderia phosphatilytica]
MQFTQMILDLVKEENGVTAMEYGLIAGFLSLVIVAGLTVGSPALQAMFNSIGASLTNAQAAAA